MFSSEAGNVRPRTEVARAFATIGLLRHVTESTPVDMICTYIFQTQQPYGLYDRAHNVNNTFKYGIGYTKTIYDVTDQDNAKNYSFPNGISKMAKDYLIRMFWKQINHIVRECLSYETYEFIRLNGNRRTRVFPDEVLKTIASIHVSSTSRLYDVRHAVATLHSVCVPVMLDPPNWIKSTRYSRRGERYKEFGIMKDCHRRPINALFTILKGYMCQNDTRQHIPNETEKSVLLDLIECFLIMFGYYDFAENYFMRQCYEYFRLENIMSASKIKQESDVFNYAYDINPKQVRSVSGNDGVDEIVEKLRNLSPEAAICINDLVGNSWRNAGCINENILKNVRLCPLNEVAIYIKTELDVQRQKKDAADRIIKSFREGRYGQTLMGNYRCCGDVCCEAPDEPAGFCA